MDNFLVFRSMCAPSLLFYFLIHTYHKQIGQYKIVIFCLFSLNFIFKTALHEAPRFCRSLLDSSSDFAKSLEYNPKVFPGPRDLALAPWTASCRQPSHITLSHTCWLPWVPQTHEAWNSLLGKNLSTFSASVRFLQKGHPCRLNPAQPPQSPISRTGAPEHELARTLPLMVNFTCQLGWGCGTWECHQTLDSMLPQRYFPDVIDI